MIMTYIDIRVPLIPDDMLAFCYKAQTYLCVEDYELLYKNLQISQGQAILFVHLDNHNARMAWPNLVPPVA
jgi:hypothetical protein